MYAYAIYTPIVTRTFINSVVQFFIKIFSSYDFMNQNQEFPCHFNGIQVCKEVIISVLDVGLVVSIQVKSIEVTFFVHFDDGPDPHKKKHFALKVFSTTNKSLGPL